MDLGGQGEDLDQGSTWHDIKICSSLVTPKKISI